jgi:hypothetical protein
MRYTIGWAVGIVIVILGIGWIAEGNQFFLAKVFAPKEEALRRRTFEESLAYNDGMKKDLLDAQIDYAKGSPEQKKAIGSVILQRFAAYDLSKLSQDQRDFLDTVRREQLTGATP